jgi:hypothetical protein
MGQFKISIDQFKMSNGQYKINTDHFKIGMVQFKISTDQLKTSIISWKLFYFIIQTVTMLHVSALKRSSSGSTDTYREYSVRMAS